MEGIGTTSLWSLCRAIDFQDLQTAIKERDSSEILPPIKDASDVNAAPLKILLLGASDPCHIIKTVARAGRHGRRNLEFVVVESQPTTFARMIVLLDALFSESETGLQDRINLFLDLYGNLLLRPVTFTHLQHRSTHFISTLPTSPTLALAPHVRITTTLLKFREKDDLDTTFQFYRSDKKPFDLAAMWDARLRRYHGARYDTRAAMVDWDYNLKLVPIFPTLDVDTYNRFRASGQCFPIRESGGSEANRTWATVERLVDPREKVGVVKWGYFSDVVVGPWGAFGGDCEDKSVLKTRNGVKVCDVGEVVEKVVGGLVREWKGRRGITREEVDSGIREIPDGADEDNAHPPSERKPTTTTIHLATPPTLPKLPRTFPTGFDHIYISAAMAHRLPEVSPFLASPTSNNSVNASKLDSRPTVIVQNVRYVIDLTKEQRAEYTKTVLAMAGKMGLEPAKHPAMEGEGGEYFIFVRGEERVVEE
ncbi:uncharacterized protein EV422DRAFT_624094 [Fimicolochytrium jonesii]|uniref:uncharacterized protein n=1 Tax=Fimicolochytrium jonesii TaxID=1396493 RepID=UPI0022FDFEBA|nr:uncharacterized protein EV422DRAFT_624094 [Fimicolochytrium jonesii]KAI8815641.1 hypothetical protein EV422DRAFT_624094 [Fimicolochytrium jonesii]